MRLRKADLDLLDALAANPRATWREIGAVVDSDATTCARRWKRLQDERLAWLVAQPFNDDGVSTLFLEVSCQPGRALAIGEALARTPRVSSAELVLGSHDLHLTSWHAGRDLTDPVGPVLAGVDGVHSYRSHLVLRTFKDGSRWRLGSLSKSAYQRIEYERTTPPPPAGGYRPHPLDHNIVALLMEDVRMPLKDVAARLEASPAIVRRRIDLLRTTRQVSLRVDAARPFLPYTSTVTLWVNAPATELTDVGKALAALPETRIVAEVVGGEANLVFSLLLGSARDVGQVESLLLSQFPSVRVLERSPSVRYLKRTTHLLGADGRDEGATGLPAELQLAGLLGEVEDPG